MNAHAREPTHIWEHVACSDVPRVTTYQQSIRETHLHVELQAYLALPQLGWAGPKPHETHGLHKLPLYVVKLTNHSFQYTLAELNGASTHPATYRGPLLTRHMSPV